MADGIGDHLTDCFDGQLVIVLPCNPFNAGAEVDVLQHEVVGIAPAPNPNRKLITGSICGVKVETIEDPLMQEIRYLDKLVDELAKGKAMEKVLRK